MELKQSSDDAFTKNMIHVFFRKSSEETKEKARIHLGMLKYLLLMIVVACLTYYNSFPGGFHFDDSHTVQNNRYVNDIHNFKLFFTETKTVSSLPQNQIYRPLFTASLCFDNWLSGYQLDPFYFHLSMIFWFLVQCVCMYFMFHKIIHITTAGIKSEWRKEIVAFISVFAAMLFSVHTVNAETLNYICSRSDSYSTLWMVIALVWYQFSARARKFHLYLIPLAIAILFKQAALVFGGILFSYIFLFEAPGILPPQLKNMNKPDPEALLKMFMYTFKRCIPALIVTVLLFWLQDHMTPKTFTASATPLYNYLITQPYVILLYFSSFFLPIHLTADTDLAAFTGVADYRFFLGIAFLFLILRIIYKTLFTKETKPIAFGLLWYLIAFLPTSLISFSEVMNDHRMFFPNVGLMLSVCWTIGLFIMKNEQRFRASKLFLPAMWVLAALLTGSYAYGTVQRNSVWASDEALWYDVTVKSPKNGRGLMNYGLSKMSKGEYALAQQYFERSMTFNPYYSYLYVNMGVLKSAMGKLEEAENCFQKAVYLDGNNPETLYFYANFLKNQGKRNEALNLAKKALELSPGHIASSNLLNEILANPNALEEPAVAAEKLVKLNPTPEAWLNLSLQYFNAAKYEACISASQEAIKLRPNYAAAYNNMCSAYNALKQWNLAIEACNKAIAISPDFVLAKNNLNWAIKQKNNPNP